MHAYKFTKICIISIIKQKCGETTKGEMVLGAKRPGMKIEAKRNDLGGNDFGGETA